MRYKKSIFNIEVDKISDDRILLYNSLTTAFGIMDKNTQEIYDNIERYTVEESASADTIVTLAKNGFILDDSIDEPSMMKYFFNRNKYNNAKLSLTIAPTLNCNMDCPYCYEKKSNIRMSEETIQNIIEFVKKKASRGIKSFNVAWYGGEPLLEKETIYFLSKVFIDLCKENNIKYTSTILTNGILLDKETAKRLAGECLVFSAQITIDGTEEIHNMRRRLLNNKNSFKIITDNIEEIKDILNVYIRVNVDKNNLSDVENLINHLYESRKWDNRVSMNFSPVVNIEDLCVYDHGACFANTDFDTIQANLTKKLMDKRGIDTRNLYPNRQFLSCSALSANGFVIDPSGDLFKCWTDVGIKDRNVGNVKEGPKLNSNFTRWVLADLPDKCRKCSTLPFCQGGCLYDTVYSNKEPVCGYNLETYKQNLKKAYELYSKANTNSNTNAQCVAAE